MKKKYPNLFFPNFYQYFYNLFIKEVNTKREKNTDAISGTCLVTLLYCIQI